MPQLDDKYLVRRWPVIFSLLSQRIKRKLTSRSKRLSQSRLFVIGYAVFGLLVLLASTVVWSLLGAHLQQASPRQLVEPLLFNNNATFQGATFPNQHSLLLKWPIFYLISLAHNTTLAYTVATVVVTAVTVFLFAALLYRIDRRPLVFGTICLALASCLLLIPSQPFVGSLGTVNMAMIATQNLEYIVYLFGLVYIARQPAFNSWRFWVAVVALALVSASDRLFLDISVGGALLATLTYGMRQRWKLVSLSVNWLLIRIMAGVTALASLWVIDAAQATHIAGRNGLMLYPTIHSLRDLGAGLGYGLSGLFTNFGANPAYDASSLHEFPSALYHRLVAISGISFLINALILVYGLFICSRFLKAGLILSKSRTIKPSTSFRLTNLLVWTGLAAFGLFVVGDHAYTLDSRLLTICLFGVFVAYASYASKKRLQPLKLLLIGFMACVGMAAAVPQLIHAELAGDRAQSDIAARNALVAQAITTHRTYTLVGDYSRVIPTKLASAYPQQITAMPLSSCTQPSQLLSSQAWQPDLHNRRFAYLLSLNKGIKGQKPCNLQQVTKFYGRPNSSELIAGSLAHPTDILLFYDQGLQHSTTGTVASTVLPIPLSQLPFTICKNTTVMNIVAHEDDDILFINPETQNELKAGNCVRSIYLTAGDNGLGYDYWYSREEGIQSAYAKMLGEPDQWIRRVVQLGTRRYATVATPRFDRRAALIFLHLPDGGVKGDGFASTGNQSLLKLNDGRISTIQSIDKQSSFTANQLVGDLANLMKAYQPTIINTQGEPARLQPGDHSDHITTGKIAEKAYEIYDQQQVDNQTAVVALHFYIGYPIRGLPVNLSDADYGTKLMTFLTYASRDSAVCHESDHCQAGSYDAYLHREYNESD